MIKPGAPPSYDNGLSTETNNPSVPALPLSDIKEHPTPTNLPQEASLQQEVDLKNSLQSLERQTISYQGRVREGGASELDAERMAEAMAKIGDSHPDPRVKSYWNGKAKMFRRADPKDRDGILEGMLKGCLILLTSPILLLGAVLQMSGEILEGLGLIFKSLGRMMKKLRHLGKTHQTRNKQNISEY